MLLRQVNGALTRSKRPIILSILLYFIGAMIAMVIFQLTDANNFSSVVSGYQRRSYSVSFGGILGNNLISTVVLIIGGITFGLLTITSLLFNGFAHSITLLVVSPTIEEFLSLFLAHSIFELPGIWLAGGVGLRVPHEFIRYLHDNEYDLPVRCVEDIVIITIISIGLITLGAGVESAVLEFGET